MQQSKAAFLCLRRPGAGNRLILVANPDMTPEIIEQAIEQMRSRAMLQSSDTEAHGIGTMTAKRWQKFFDICCRRMAFMPRPDWRRRLPRGLSIRHKPRSRQNRGRTANWTRA